MSPRKHFEELWESPTATASLMRDLVKIELVKRYGEQDEETLDKAARKLVSDDGHFNLPSE